jgi:hypothetical protein
MSNLCKVGQLYAGSFSHIEGKRSYRLSLDRAYCCFPGHAHLDILAHSQIHNCHGNRYCQPAQNDHE